MSWNAAGSLTVVNGNPDIVGTSTLFLGAYVGDALVYADGTTYYVQEIASITDNTHLALQDNWPGSSGSVANGDWSILPCSPLRSSAATTNSALATIIATYGSILSLTSSDNTITLNKAASGNNANIVLNTANVAMAQIGCVGDNNLHLQVNLNGGGYSDVFNASQVTGLATVIGDPTNVLGIATKQYVDGALPEHEVRLAVPVATGNISISSPGTSTFDGVTAANGDVILLPAQTTASQNGPWVFNGSAVAMTRPTWFATAYVSCMDSFRVMEGNTLAGTTWKLTTVNPIRIGSTSLTITQSGAPIGTSGNKIPLLSGANTFSAAQIIASAAAAAVAVGANGATNPAFVIDASTASSATGLKVKSAAAAAGLALSVISSGTNENLTIDAKGSGTITLGSVSTGAIILNTATTISSALTVGGNITAAFGTTGVGLIGASFTQTDSTTGAGTVATAYASVQKAVTFATASNAITITNAYGAFFNTPAAGSNVTVTNAWGLGTANANFTTKLQGPDSAAWTSTGISNLTKLGIGMAPSNVLDITQNQNGLSAIALLNNSAGTAGRLALELSNGTSTGYIIQNGTGYTTSGMLRQDGLAISAGGGGGLTLITQTAQPIYFGVNSSEVARFDTSGRLLIGASSGTNKLLIKDATDQTEANAQFSINGNAYSANHWLDGIAYYIGQNSNARALRMYSGSTNTAGVQLSSGSTSWTTYSDERLKNVLPDQTNLRAAICDLWIGEFEFKKDGRYGFGVLAQQANSVLPDGLKDVLTHAPMNDNDWWTAAAEPAAYLALWGVKDLYCITETHESRLALAEATITSLQDEIVTLKKAA